MKKALALIMLMVLSIWTNAALAVFSDVPLQHPHSKSIDYVRDQGIVKGYADGSFKPDQRINRAEFTKIIIGAVVGQEPIEHAGQCFPDVSSDMWFYPYVCYAKRTNIISGFPDGTFRPDKNISFAEAAKIVANSFGLPSASGEPWYQPFIDALAQKNAVPSSLNDPNKLVTRGEMAEIIYRLKTSSSDQPNIIAPQSQSPLKQQVIDLTNVERQKAGLSPLSFNTFLEKAAQVHADDMQTRDYFDHISPEGQNHTDRIKAAGYLDEFDACKCTKSYAVGENIAKGQITAAEVVETWMNSPEHKANILNPKFTEIGIGIIEITQRNRNAGENFQGSFWVQNFGDVNLER